MIILAIVLTLVGGGKAPPYVLVLAAIAGWTMRSRLSRLKRLLPMGLRRFLGALWPWLVGLFLSWIPMEIALGLFFGVGYPTPGYALSFTLPGIMLVALMCSLARDSVAE